MLKVGIISSWHVHTNDYAKQLADGQKAQITAMWDENPARGEEWAARNNAAFFADYDRFLAEGGFDAVICNSPTTMHPQLLQKAAEAGKHIFTEKLLAVSANDCEMLCRAIETAGVVFTISLPLRSSGQMLYAKQLVDSGALGRVTGARMRRSHNGTSAGWLPAYWYDTAMSGGGAMMDLGAHPVYMLAYLFGCPKRLTAMTSNLYGTSSDENAIALAEFEGGLLGTCETAFVTTGVPDILEIYGTEGSLFIHGDRVERSDNDGRRLIPAAELPQDKPLPLAQFVDACLNGTGTPEDLGLSDALVMTKMIEASYTADQSGVTIKF